MMIMMVRTEDHDQDDDHDGDDQDGDHQNMISIILWQLLTAIGCFEIPFSMIMMIKLLMTMVKVMIMILYLGGCSERSTLSVTSLAKSH